MELRNLLCVAYALVSVCERANGREVSVEERRVRAAFVQRILNRYRSMEGDIKLVGGRTRYEGNVYIRHAGRWGAVCDDSWRGEEAALVCRRLYNRTGRATHSARFGLATAKYWMDNVVCAGGERALSECPFAGWGVADCGPADVAGVVCDEPGAGVGEGGVTFQAAGAAASVGEMVGATRPLHEALEGALQLRLAGGRNRSEGRVEILHGGAWGGVCGAGWGLREARAVCRQLRLGWAAAAPRHPLDTAVAAPSPQLSGVRCRGDEESLALCHHRQLGGASCHHTEGAVAGVVCTHAVADLVLDWRQLEQSAHLQDVPLYQLQCAMEEFCLTESAYETQRTNPGWQLETRRLLRFTAAAANLGSADFRPATPKHQWQWHLCHMHYHSMEVFATFDVLNLEGQRVAQGHKASFCLEDNACLSGLEKKYDCRNYGDQGISVNCTDIYHYSVDCQWVDITELSPGSYQLLVAVNPQAMVPEQSYSNNAALCDLLYTETQAVVSGCKLRLP